MQRSISVSTSSAQDTPITRPAYHRRATTNHGSKPLLVICALSAVVVLSMYLLIKPKIQLHQKATVNFIVEGAALSFPSVELVGSAL